MYLQLLVNMQLFKNKKLLKREKNPPLFPFVSPTSPSHKHMQKLNSSFFSLNFILFLSFQGRTWRFPGQGSNRSCSCRHMEVPRLGIESELQLQAYTTATVTCDLIRICNLHHSSWQRRILHPLSGPGIKLVSLWMLVRFVSTEPRWECLSFTFVKPNLCVLIIK